MKLGPPDANETRTGLTRLVGGDAPWPDPGETDAVSYAPLDGDASCDVVVLGAGITGAICAALLVDEGLDVMLLDKHTVASGSTSANTALLLFEPDQPLHRLSEMLGTQDADTVYRLCHEALDDVARLARRVDEWDGSGGNGTRFAWRPSLILASKSGDIGSLYREFEARLRHGYPTALLKREELESRYSFSAPAALWSRHAAQMDPYRFTRGLVAEAAGRGLRVHERTAVVDYEPEHERAVLTTECGHHVRARHLIFATGYETERYTSRKLAQDNTTFAILTDPLEEIAGWPDRALIWETAESYIYLRVTDDSRVLIGGLDEKTVDAGRRDAILPGKSEQLLARLRTMFPDIDTRVARAWTGTFLTTHDSLPYIGQLPEAPHAWFALAYGGNGTTFAMIAATMLRDAISGRPRAEAELFRFDRPTAR